MAEYANWFIGLPLKPRNEAVRFIKAAMPDLARRACAEGWQTQLLGFVQYQHRKPTGEQIARLIDDASRIDVRLAAMDEGTARVWRRDDILAKREALKADLLAPMQAVAA